jgi:hypothetical protein
MVDIRWLGLVFPTVGEGMDQMALWGPVPAKMLQVPSHNQSPLPLAKLVDLELNPVCLNPGPTDSSYCLTSIPALPWLPALPCYMLYTGLAWTVPPHCGGVPLSQFHLDGRFPTKVETASLMAESHCLLTQDPAHPTGS